MSDSTPKDNETHPDLLTLDQINQIQKEVAETQPIISKELNFDHLRKQYENAHLPGFKAGIECLNGSFKYMRAIRGDGSCFYRALLFGYLENLLQLHNSSRNEAKENAQKELGRMRAIISESVNTLVAVGYSEFVLETFQEEFLELLDMLFTQSLESLLEMFQEGGKADYLTWYLRALTAGYLKTDAERFLPFIEGSYVDIHDFCRGEVEPMNKECEHIQIIALTEYLGVPVDISYLDGREFDQSQGLNTVKFPENPVTNLFVIKLLYRPGHYDLLYNQ